jgi:hypothetical protein
MTIATSTKEETKKDAKGITKKQTIKTSSQKLSGFSKVD